MQTKFVEVSDSYERGAAPEIMMDGKVIARTYWWGPGDRQFKRDMAVKLADVVANALNFYFNEIDGEDNG